MAFTNFKIVESKRCTKGSHREVVKKGPIVKMGIVTYVKGVFYASIRGSHYQISKKSLEPITPIVYSTPYNGIFENWTPTSVQSAEVFTNDCERWCSVKPGMLIYGEVIEGQEFRITHYGRKFAESDIETSQDT